MSPPFAKPIRVLEIASKAHELPPTLLNRVQKPQVNERAAEVGLTFGDGVPLRAPAVSVVGCAVVTEEEADTWDENVHVYVTFYMGKVLFKVGKVIFPASQTIIVVGCRCDVAVGAQLSHEQQTTVHIL